MTAQLRPAFIGSAAQLVGAFSVGGTAIAPPALNATRAYAVNALTGQPYYVKNSNTTDTVPASLTKAMTAYVLLQKKSAAQILSQTTTIVWTDQVGGSGDNLVNGDVITLHSLLADTMLPSSNPAATAIARVIGQEIRTAEGGSTDATAAVARFVTEMNTYAAALGMSGSTWRNPSGLDEVPNNVTTPTDICTVMSALWGYSTMVGIWALGSTYAMPVTRSGSPTTVTITSSNLMIADTGVVGGKTGTTSSANLSILWRAPSTDVVSLTVINAGTDGRYVDIRAMIARLPIDYPELAVVPMASAPSNTVVPTITGSAVQGSTLTASTGTWANGVTGYAYRWLRGATAIIGATASTYVLQAGDVGSQIRVGVIATNATGSSTEALSLQTAVVTAPAGDTTPPALTGTISITSLTPTSYTATCPAATDAGGVTGYQYRIDAGAWTTIAAAGRSVAITGRTADATDALEMRAFDAAPNYSAALAYSVVLPAVSTGGSGALPVIDTNPVDASAAEGGSATFSVAATGDGLAYQWLLDGVEIPGETASAITVMATLLDSGAQFSARVSNSAGSVLSAYAVLSVAETAGAMTAAEERQLFRWVNELAGLHGLLGGRPLAVSSTRRSAAGVTQAISDAGGTTTVTRQ